MKVGQIIKFRKEPFEIIIIDKLDSFIILTIKAIHNPAKVLQINSEDSEIEVLPYAQNLLELE